MGQVMGSWISAIADLGPVFSIGQQYGANLPQ